MTFEYEKEQYDQNGFVIVRQLLADKDFTELKQNLDRYIRDVVPSLPDVDAFYQDRSRPETLKQMQRMGGDAYFQEYIHHQKWKALAEAMIGEPATVDQPEWFNKPPATHHVTPPHQDNYYFCLKPANVLTIWMALDHGTRSRGCGERMLALRQWFPSAWLSQACEIADSRILAGDHGLHHG